MHMYKNTTFRYIHIYIIIYIYKHAYTHTIHTYIYIYIIIYIYLYIYIYIYIKCGSTYTDIDICPDRISGPTPRAATFWPRVSDGSHGPGIVQKVLLTVRRSLGWSCLVSSTGEIIVSFHVQVFNTIVGVASCNSNVKTEWMWSRPFHEADLWSVAVYLARSKYMVIPEGWETCHYFSRFCFPPSL